MKDLPVAETVLTRFRSIPLKTHFHRGLWVVCERLDPLRLLLSAAISALVTYAFLARYMPDQLLNAWLGGWSVFYGVVAGLAITVIYDFISGFVTIGDFRFRVPFLVKAGPYVYQEDGKLLLVVRVVIEDVRGFRNEARLDGAIWLGDADDELYLRPDERGCLRYDQQEPQVGFLRLPGEFRDWRQGYFVFGVQESALPPNWLTFVACGALNADLVLIERKTFSWRRQTLERPRMYGY